jgi:HlyD family secretion protein
MMKNRFNSNLVYGLCPLLLLVVGCGPPAAAQKGEEKPAEEAALRVSVVAPQKKTLVRRTEQPGQVRAFEETPVFAEVTGRVKKVHVDVGDPVRGPKLDEQGQVLLEIDAPEMLDDLQQKKALVAQADAQIKQAAAAIRVAKAAENAAAAGVAEAEATVDRAEAFFVAAQSEMERVNDLFVSKASTQKLVDEATSRLKAADAARKEVAAKITSAKSLLAAKAAGLEQANSDLDAAKSKLDVAKADERRAQTLIQFLTIRAPYNGTVTARNVDRGHLVQTGKNSTDKPLLVVVDATMLRVLVDVPEGDAPLVQVGSEVLLRTPAVAGPPVAGKVTRTAWVLQPATRTLRVEIDVPSNSGKLRPGMYVYADLKLAERKDAMALPKTAILTQENQSFCLAVNGENKIVRLPIQVGIRAGEEVEVVSGLKGSERVIALNAAAYREGQTVEIVPPAAK